MGSFLSKPENTDKPIVTYHSIDQISQCQIDQKIEVENVDKDHFSQPISHFLQAAGSTGIVSQGNQYHLHNEGGENNTIIGQQVQHIYPPVVSKSSQDQIWRTLVASLTKLYKEKKAKLIPFEWLEWNTMKVDKYFVDLELQELEEGEKFKAKSSIQFEDILKDSNCILIQAEGGFGKTTLLTKMASDWAHGKSFFQNEYHLVLFYRLRDLPVGGDLEKELVGFCKRSCYVKSEEGIRNLLCERQSKILLLLDGFDELPLQAHESIRRVIDIDQYSEESLSVFGLCKIVVTTRPFSKIPKQFLAFDKFIQIVGLSKKSQSKFVEIYFSKDLQYELLYRKLEESGLIVLTNLSPLMLYIICFLEKENELGETKIEETDLMSKICRYLGLKCIERGNLEISEAEMNDAFLRMGRFCLKMESTLIIAEDDVRKEIDEPKLVDFLLKCGLFNKQLSYTTDPKSKVIYEPIHKSFIDYLSNYFTCRDFSFENEEADDALLILKRLSRDVVLPEIYIHGNERIVYFIWNYFVIFTNESKYNFSVSFRKGNWNDVKIDNLSLANHDVANLRKTSFPQHSSCVSFRKLNWNGVNRIFRLTNGNFGNVPKISFVLLLGMGLSEISSLIERYLPFFSEHQFEHWRVFSESITTHRYRNQIQIETLINENDNRERVPCLDIEIDNCLIGGQKIVNIHFENSAWDDVDSYLQKLALSNEAVFRVSLAPSTLLNKSQAAIFESFSNTLELTTQLLRPTGTTILQEVIDACRKACNFTWSIVCFLSEDDGQLFVIRSDLALSREIDRRADVCRGESILKITASFENTILDFKQEGLQQRTIDVSSFTIYDSIAAKVGRLNSELHLSTKKLVSIPSKKFDKIVKTFYGENVWHEIKESLKFEILSFEEKHFRLQRPIKHVSRIFDLSISFFIDDEIVNIEWWNHLNDLSSLNEYFETKSLSEIPLDIDQRVTLSIWIFEEDLIVCRDILEDFGSLARSSVKKKMPSSANNLFEIIKLLHENWKLTERNFVIELRPYNSELYTRYDIDSELMKTDVYNLPFPFSLLIALEENF